MTKYFADSAVPQGRPPPDSHDATSPLSFLPPSRQG